MSTKHYGINDSHIAGDIFYSWEWNILSRLVDSQLSGAMTGIGSGLLAYPDETSFLVEEDSGGTGLVVNPGSGIADSTPYGPIFLSLPTAITIDGDALTANSDDNFIYAAIRITVGQTGNITNDSRQGAPPSIIVRPNGDLTGALLLAQVTVDAGGNITDIEDKRVFQSLAALKSKVAVLETDVADLKEAVGLPYTDEDSLSVRVLAIEASLAASSGGDGTVSLVDFANLVDAVAKNTQDIADLKAMIGGEAPTAVRTYSRTESLRAEHARLAVANVRLNSRLSMKLKSTIVVPGKSGMNDKLPDGTRAKNVSSGNLRQNRAKREVE